MFRWALTLAVLAGLGAGGTPPVRAGAAGAGALVPDSSAAEPVTAADSSSADSSSADSLVVAPARRWWPAVPPGDPWYPTAVLFLPGGQVVVADTDQNRLYLMDEQGRRTRRLPLPDRSPLEWTALAAAPGLSFYALDGPGAAVYQYDLQGNYLGLALDMRRVAEEEGLGDLDPAGLAVDATGRAVITDRLGDRLLVFGPGWTFLGVWGQTGREPGSWRRPGRVAAGPGSQFLVADEGNHRVVRVDAFGSVTGARVLEEAPRGVAVLHRGYAVSTPRGIEILGPDLERVRTFGLPRARDCSRRPFATRALDASAAGILAGEGCSGRVVEISVTGE